MTLNQLGLNQDLQEHFLTLVPELDQLARVVQEHKELYTVQNERGTFKAEITGNLRYAAADREDFPAVGDWVAMNVFDGDSTIIYKVLPRFSKLERQAVGAQGEKQLIATNIDFAFIVQAVDRDFNLNRLERYFVLVNNGNIQPIIVLNKADLIDEEALKSIRTEVANRLKNPLIFSTSTVDGSGLAELKNQLHASKTYCFLGSSGVGKSSIINFLVGNKLLEVSEISKATSKGKHTTTHRELVVLDDGSILIDTPGMREVGMIDSSSGLEMTFGEISKWSRECRFSDCTHTDEPGCKVLQAIHDGVISREELENFNKLQRQAEHFTSTLAQKRSRDKTFGKMVKEVMKYKKKNKY
jgi:ribosome biogenesis GTPase